MKAVISNKIYISVDDEFKAELQAKLTYPLIRRGRGGKPIPYKYRDYINVRKDIIAIPVGRTDLIPEGFEIVDKRVAPTAKFPTFNMTLREDQQEVYDLVEGSHIINAQPSWGKTFSGIAIARKLGLKTIVVVHTLFLLDQWVAEIEKTLGIKPSLITKGKCNIEGPIVVANVQSLKKFAKKVGKEFGTIILDEGHHTPASTFSDILSHFYAKNRICLSATLKRKDGLEVLLTGLFSHKIIKPKEANNIRPQILAYDVPVQLSDDNSMPWALRIGELYNEPTYQKTVIELAHQFSQVQKLPTLVVSNRIDFLAFLHEILEEDSVLITGETKNREELVQLVKDGKKNLIFGTTSIFAEGLNIPRLACLIPAQPMKNDPLLEQLCGRVARLHPGKEQAFVLDLRLQGRAAGTQAIDRIKTYARLGYKIKKLPPLP